MSTKPSVPAFPVPSHPKSYAVPYLPEPVKTSYSKITHTHFLKHYPQTIFSPIINYQWINIRFTEIKQNPMQYSNKFDTASDYITKATDRFALTPVTCYPAFSPFPLSIQRPIPGVLSYRYPPESSDRRSRFLSSLPTDPPYRRWQLRSILLSFPGKKRQR